MPEPTTTDATKQQIGSRGLSVQRGHILIEFLVGQPPYNAGETAAFPAEVAERYLRARIKTSSGMRDVAKRAKSVKILMPKDDDVPDDRRRDDE